MRANAALERASGEEQGSLEGRPFAAFVPLDERARVECFLRTLTRGESVRFECGWQRKDGSQTRLIWHFAPSRADGAAYGSAHEAAPSTREALEGPHKAAPIAHEAIESACGLPVLTHALGCGGLWDSSTQLALLIANAPMVLFAIDHGGHILRVEGAMPDTLEIARIKLTGESVFDLWHDQSEVLQALRRALAGESTSALVRYRDKTFEARFMPVRGPCGDTCGVAGMATDVTERQRAEDALRQSEAQFRQLIECAPDAIMVHREGRVVYCNPNMVRLLGYERAEDLLGRPVLEILQTDERSPVIERVSRIMSKEPMPPIEEQLRRRDGSLIAADLSSIPVEYDGRPAALVFARDLSERREIEARLRQADRLVSVGTLAAGVAHEMNTPLAYVLANIVWAAEQATEIARSDAPAWVLRQRVATLAEPLNEAKRGAERVRDIVRDLRALSRPEPEQRAKVDVCAVLDSALQMAHAEIQCRARLVKRYEPVPPVEANESRLAQVFLNLLINAAQAITPGDVARNEISVTVRNVPGAVLVEVADTGCGIPPEVLGRIFDPFFTTKPVGVGTGLGLSICHGIVSALGGRITVQSEVGRGSTFRVMLPARTRAVQTPTHGLAQVDRASSSTPRMRVLVVDDEPAIGAALRRVLGSAYEVTTVRSGHDALKLFAMRDFDAVLCDLIMPGMTGMDLYERVRAERPALAARFVFLTGDAFTAQAHAFLQQVPNRSVLKPFDPEEIREALHEAAEHKPDGCC